MSDHTLTCAYPGCCGHSGQHIYCKYHYSLIKQEGLCYSCLQKKERATLRLCQKCYQDENTANRQAAIDAGLCTQYWKCSQPATCQGGMCSEHFEEYMMEKHQRKAVESRQIAIKAGRCSNFWKCDKPAMSQGGMCAECFHSHTKRQGFWVAVKKPAPARSPLILEVIS